MTTKNAFLEKRYNTWFATMKIPKDVQPFFGKTKFDITLKTDSLQEANLRKLPVVYRWKQMIKAARAEGTNHTLEAEMTKARTFWDAEGWAKVEPEQQYFALDALADTLNDKGYDIQEITIAQNLVSGRWCRTAEHVEDWLAEPYYTEKSIAERRSIVKKFAKDFPILEQITKEQLRRWASEALSEFSQATVKKRISVVRTYWSWLLENGRAEAAIVVLDGLLTKKLLVGKSKLATQALKKTERQAFMVADYKKLLAEAERIEDGELVDTIRLGAHTGCRIEELFGLRVEDTTNRFVIKNAKTAAGWREVPIHRDVAQLVERLKQTSTDGYLLPSTSKNKYGIRSDPMSKRFGRLKASLGYGPEHVFHSFRKLLITLLHEADVPESHTAAIVGHELQTMSYGTYSAPLSFNKKVEIFEKFSLR
jgi:integrase